MRIALIRFPTSFPGDIRGLDRILEEKKIQPELIRAILSKTNGSGAGNDYSRVVAEYRYTRYLMRKFSTSSQDLLDDIAFITSSGCEGLAAPNGYLLYERRCASQEQGGLVAGFGRTERLNPVEIGTAIHVRAVEGATRAAVQAAGLSGSEKVGVVFVKSPIDPNASDVSASISMTRRAAAVGVGVALGEIDFSDTEEILIERKSAPFSEKAFVFSGNELQECRVVVFGCLSGGEQQMACGVYDDLMNIDALESIIRGKDKPRRVTALFAKVSESLGGHPQSAGLSIRSSDLPRNREIRAAASGVFAALLKDTHAFISVGAENQGPPGGGIVAVVYTE